MHASSSRRPTLSAAALLAVALAASGCDSKGGTSSDSFHVTVARPVGGTIVSLGADGQPDGILACGTASPANTTANACGPARYPLNATVTLAAIPDATYRFEGWSVDCNGTASCVLDATTNRADRTVAAQFAIAGPQPLTWDQGSWDQAVWR